MVNWPVLDLSLQEAGVVSIVFATVVGQTLQDCFDLGDQALGESGIVKGIMGMEQQQATRMVKGNTTPFQDIMGDFAMHGIY